MSVKTLRFDVRVISTKDLLGILKASPEKFRTEEELREFQRRELTKRSTKAHEGHPLSKLSKRPRTQRIKSKQ